MEELENLSDYNGEKLFAYLDYEDDDVETICKFLEALGYDFGLYEPFCYEHKGFCSGSPTLEVLDVSKPHATFIDVLLGALCDFE